MLNQEKIVLKPEIYENIKKFADFVSNPFLFSYLCQILTFFDCVVIPMARNRQTVFNFLNVTESSSTIDRQNLDKIRAAYTNVKDGSSLTTDDPLKVVADKFMLTDDAVNLEHLKICVSSGSVGIACQAIWSKYIDTLVAAEGITTKRNHSPRTSASAGSAISIVVCEATCRILLKRNHTALMEFVQDFLLAPFHQNASSTHK